MTTMRQIICLCCGLRQYRLGPRVSHLLASIDDHQADPLQDDATSGTYSGPRDRTYPRYWSPKIPLLRGLL